MEELVKATKDARERTGKLIATNVEKGLWQVVEVEYKDDGSSKVTPLSDRIPGPEVIPFLNSLG